MLNRRELATVLAALRLWQARRENSLSAVTPAAGQMAALEAIHHCEEELKPLRTREIDQLCERLNTNEPLEDIALLCRDMAALGERCHSVLERLVNYGWVEPSVFCECELPSYFCSGVPGILAHFANGRLAPGAAVERCDLCQRFASDKAALAKLQELGLA
jgi:hypothetical protein